MLKSMTGFAQAVFMDEKVPMTLTVRTYNSRFLDFNFRLSNTFYPLEDRIKAYISSRISRGRVDIFLQSAGPEKNRNGNMTINWPLAETGWRLLTELKKKLDLPGPIDLTHLLSLKDLIVYREPSLSEEDLWLKLSHPLKEVFDDLQKMRLQEGRNLTRDLQDRLKFIQERAEEISTRVSLVVEAYRIRLKDRVEKLTRGLEMDPARLAQEVALLADRSDISEELIRLKSHGKQFKSLFKENQPAGKKMEFLLQEMNREVNTIGSKSMDSEISHLVVSIKAELEKVREQVQNIE
jgi:uncharacterized protein (TIGR00255 family)